MKRLKSLGFLAALSFTALLTACHDDNETGAQAAQTTSELADQEIVDNTTDRSTPLPINQLDISDDDTNDTALPRAI